MFSNFEACFKRSFVYQFNSIHKLLERGRQSYKEIQSNKIIQKAKSKNPLYHFKMDIL